VSSVVNDFGGLFAAEDTEVTETVPFSSLLPNDVHVWRVPLNQSSVRTPLLQEVLSPDERRKAARFHFEKDRNQFIQSRAALRIILARYLNIAPRKLDFCLGPYGKPALANGLAESKLRFNVSRRDGLALVAVAYDREVGIDVEYVRADLPIFEIAKGSFSPAEVTALDSLPQRSRILGFYNCWTRKEAYVKARGEGLSLPLDQFSVSLTPGEPARLLQVIGDRTEVGNWMMQDLSVGENYIAALAVAGTNLNLTLLDFGISEAPKARNVIAWANDPGQMRLGRMSADGAKYDLASSPRPDENPTPSS
jgi:4'-phosphopantetheinyl transferase